MTSGNQAKFRLWYAATYELCVICFDDVMRSTEDKRPGMDFLKLTLTDMRFVCNESQSLRMKFCTPIYFGKQIDKLSPYLYWYQRYILNS